LEKERPKEKGTGKIYVGRDGEKNEIQERDGLKERKERGESLLRKKE